jgi:NAD(P)-dependent dehydrogenase (short-subunit alcohol dehydrogenase family)
VIITGAARGIGAATARRFCEEGARVVLADQDAGGVEATAAVLRAAGYDSHARAVDVTDEGALRAVLDEAAELFGGLDVALANAGVLSVGPLSALSQDDLERTLRVNVLGTFLTFRLALAHLRRSGGGALLCTASQAGVRGYRDMSAYCASKFAVVGLVKSLAQELADDGIRVCAVAPGITATEMYQELVDERAALWDVDSSAAEQRLHRTVPMGRPATPEEVANAFVYLASPAASYVSGIALVIDGGEVSA